MTNDKHKSGKLPVASQILSYLAKNPDAEDTLEGIVEWWLWQQQIEIESRIVKQALAELIAQGLVKEVKGPDRRTFYRVNGTRIKEVQEILKDKS